MATIALDNLKPQEQLKLSPLPQDTTDYASIINSAVGNPMELDKQVQGQETQVQSSLNTLSNLMQEGAGIGSQQLAMENQAGISQQQKEVQDLTNQLNSIKTQANVIPMQIQQESAGRGRTEAGIAPLQTAELRNNAIQALTVGAQLQAKQGNLALAQSQIDRAIELKYRDIENRTKLAELNYNRNKETLERIDKKRADALGYAIQKQKEKDAENKANEMKLNELIINASSQGAPSDVLARAQKATTPREAAMILGEYSGDFYKTMLLKAQIDTERAQARKYNADIDKIKSEMNTKGLPATTANVAKVEASQSVYDLANELKTLAGKGGAVGFGIKKSVIGSIPFVEGTAIAGTERANYEAKFKQLKDTLASANLDKLKGAMSDKDIEFLRNIGTALSLDMSEESFDKELEKVAQTMANVPGVQKLAPKPQSNKFQTSLGINSGGYSGSSIISNVSESGDINFSIPK